MAEVLWASDGIAGININKRGVQASFQQNSVLYQENSKRIAKTRAIFNEFG